MNDFIFSQKISISTENVAIIKMNRMCGVNMAVVAAVTSPVEKSFIFMKAPFCRHSVGRKKFL